MNEAIGMQIKMRRKNMGLNQADIAHFLNVDQSLISKVESGERNISSDMLEKLACLFGVGLEELESDNASKLTFAFRAGEWKAEDMETISAIQRIALNCEQMDKILEGEEG